MADVEAAESKFLPFGGTTRMSWGATSSYFVPVYLVRVPPRPSGTSACVTFSYVSIA